MTYPRAPSSSTTTSSTVSATVSTTFVADAMRYVRRRSSTRSSAYATSRFVNAQMPNTPNAISVASCVPRTRSDSGPASSTPAASASVVVSSTNVVVVRARWRRRSGCSSSNHERTNASPMPKRSRMLARITSVSSVSAYPKSAGVRWRV